MSQEPVTKSLGTNKYAPEVALREMGKWETVRKHSLTLKNGKWSQPRLEVTYVARQAGLLDRQPSTVPFALLVSVRDLGASGTLYEEVRNQFSVLTTVRSTADIRIKT